MTSDALGTPPAEVMIDLALVNRLLNAQFPDLAGLPAKITEEGYPTAHRNGAQDTDAVG